MATGNAIAAGEHLIYKFSMGEHGMMVAQRKDRKSPDAIFAAGETAEFVRAGNRIHFCKTKARQSGRPARSHKTKSA
jgi:hypothetical protein